MKTLGMFALRAGAVSAAEREANEQRLVELVMAPRHGVGVTFGCSLDVLVRSDRRITTGRVLEVGSGALTVQAAPGWRTDTCIELEILTEPESGIGPRVAVAGVIRAVDGTTVSVELDPVPDEREARVLRRFMLEAIRCRVLDN